MLAGHQPIGKHGPLRQNVPQSGAGQQILTIYKSPPKQADKKSIR
jgi:hypothetical protein